MINTMRDHQVLLRSNRFGQVKENLISDVSLSNTAGNYKSSLRLQLEDDDQSLAYEHALQLADAISTKYAYRRRDLASELRRNASLERIDDNISAFLKTVHADIFVAGNIKDYDAARFGDTFIEGSDFRLMHSEGAARHRAVNIARPVQVIAPNPVPKDINSCTVYDFSYGE